MSGSTEYAKKLFDTERTQSLEQIYTEWADTYDNDIMSDLGCTAKDELVKSMMTHIENQETTMLLDLAAGTGVAGQLLRKQGYKGIMDGLEPNVAMLKKAEEKGIYRKYICSTITNNEELLVDKETYDGITILGGFCVNHLEQGSLVHIIPALKRGGVIAFYTRNTGQIHEEYRLELDKVVHDLVRAGQLELVEARNVLHFQNVKQQGGEDLFVKLYICKKL